MSENFTFIPLGKVVIVVTAVVLVINLIEIVIAMTLSICPFDNLYIYILLEIFNLMLLALQVVAIELVVGTIVIVVVEL
jgi:hypothetical protein